MAEHHWRWKGRGLASSVKENEPSSRSRKSACTRNSEFRRPLGNANGRFTRSQDHTPSYVWRCPEESLTERRSKAEQRREELLHIIYQDDVSTSGEHVHDVDDLVREWVDLVVERDQLFREQLNQENRYYYFRELQRLLREQPPLGDDSEEVTIRGTLRDLERCVSRFCRKQNMALSPEKSQLLASQVFSKPRTTTQSQKPSCEAQPTSYQPPSSPRLRSSMDQSGRIKQQLEFRDHSAHLLDQETGQTGTEIQDQEQENSTSSGSLFKGSKTTPTSPFKPSSIPAAIQLGKECTENEQLAPGADSGKNCTSGQPSNQFSPSHQYGRQGTVSCTSLSHIPPVNITSPPPLPTTPPFNLQPSALPQLGPLGMYGGSKGVRGVGGVSGTVQFAGMNYGTSAAKNCCRDDRDDEVGSYLGSDEEEMTAPLRQRGDRKHLMLEISNIGRSTLKQTNRPRSPGGTPVRPPNSSEAVGGGGVKNCGMISMNSPSYSHCQQQRNSDLLQKALLAKFRSLHSTPIKQKGNGRQLDYSNSFDLSSAWSEINSSVQVYDDPDITSTSTFNPSTQSSSKTINKSTNRHNCSTAV